MISLLVCGRCQLTQCDECQDLEHCECRRPQHLKLTSPGQQRDHWEETEYGVRWGPIQITRMSTFDRGPKNGGFVRVLNVTAGQPSPDKDLHIYVSETGRSVRVFRGGKELE